MDIVLQISALLFLDVLQTVVSMGEKLQTEVHLTQGAAKAPNDLWCYKCSTSDDMEKCLDIRYNHTSLVHKCKDEKRQCTVKRYSYTTSTENTTSLLKLWSLERECTKSCTPGCIIIGERTKLYACTTCCSEPLCNRGSDATRREEYGFSVGSLIVIEIIFFASH